jgi:hypothetical protein
MSLLLLLARAALRAEPGEGLRVLPLRPLLRLRLRLLLRRRTGLLLRLRLLLPPFLSLLRSSFLLPLALLRLRLLLLLLLGLRRLERSLLRLRRLLLPSPRFSVPFLPLSGLLLRCFCFLGVLSSSELASESEELSLRDFFLRLAPLSSEDPESADLALSDASDPLCFEDGLLECLEASSALL